MEDLKIKKQTPLRSIRANCLECSNQQPVLVRECHIINCHLWNFRFGKNPLRKGIKKGFRPITLNKDVLS